MEKNRVDRISVFIHKFFTNMQFVDTITPFWKCLQSGDIILINVELLHFWTVYHAKHLNIIYLARFF